MFKKFGLAGLAFLAAAALVSTLLWADGPSDLKAAVDKSMKAMGAENLNTIVISGEGFDGCVGQQYSPNSPWWRKYYDKNYVRSIDLEARGWRL
jgi:hypothetical protein